MVYCPVCNYDFIDHEILSIHLYKEHDKRLLCSSTDCTEFFRTEQAMLEHHEAEHQGLVHYCSDCRTAFCRRGGFGQHRTKNGRNCLVEAQKIHVSELPVGVPAPRKIRKPAARIADTRYNSNPPAFPRLRSTVVSSVRAASVGIEESVVAPVAVEHGFQYSQLHSGRPAVGNLSSAAADFFANFDPNDLPVSVTSGSLCPSTTTQVLVPVVEPDVHDDSVRLPSFETLSGVGCGYGNVVTSATKDVQTEPVPLVVPIAERLRCLNIGNQEATSYVPKDVPKDVLSDRMARLSVRELPSIDIESKLPLELPPSKYCCLM